MQKRKIKIKGGATNWTIKGNDDSNMLAIQEINQTDRARIEADKQMQQRKAEKEEYFIDMQIKKEMEMAKLEEQRNKHKMGIEMQAEKFKLGHKHYDALKDGLTAVKDATIANLEHEKFKYEKDHELRMRAIDTLDAKNKPKDLESFMKTLMSPKTNDITGGVARQTIGFYRDAATAATNALEGPTKNYPEEGSSGTAHALDYEKGLSRSPSVYGSRSSVSGGVSRSPSVCESIYSDPGEERSASSSYGSRNISAADIEEEEDDDDEDLIREEKRLDLEERRLALQMRKLGINSMTPEMEEKQLELDERRLELDDKKARLGKSKRY